MQNNFMRIFITGGAGFIGIHLCKKISQFHKVTVYDNFSNSNQKDFPTMSNVTLVIGDILNKSKLSYSMKNHDVVIHLAAKSDVIDSVNNPDDTFQTNVNGTQNVLDSCISNDITKFIVTSSAAVYKSSDSIILESSDTQPLSPYGQSKLDMEKITVSSGTRYSILRLFNVYGDGSTGGVIANFTKNISESKPLVIFGDGKAVRDFIHIDDVVEGIVLCMDSKSGIHNIASGVGTSVLQLVNLLTRSTGEKIIYKSARTGEITYSVADITKSRKELGFFPKISLNDGLKSIMFNYS
jgi:UDP-glucose 4-epimerase